MAGTETAGTPTAADAGGSSAPAGAAPRVTAVHPPGASAAAGAAPAAASAKPASTPAAARLAGLDGLRAIAVLAVVLYHADLGILPGGFLGVDVFFVISGFLITTLLLAEHGRLGRIRLRAFWARRARRLLPALFLVLASTLTLAVVFAPDEVARLRGDTLAALAYVTNWYLILRQQSYFEAMGRPSPLLHLWSLAVEEQFYVLWPIALAGGLVLLRRRGMLALSLAGAAGSALLMAWLYRPDVDPSRIYYGTDTHATGLLLGAALALAWTPAAAAAHDRGGSTPAAAHERDGSTPAAATGEQRPLPPWPEEPPEQRPARPPIDRRAPVLGLLGVAGLLAIGAAFAWLDEFEPLLYRGGFVAVDLAVALVIVAAVHPLGWIGRRVLDRQPLRWIGERSYGIYLWHWPIFTLTRPQLDVPLDPVPDLVLRLALTLVAAEASYRFLETPIRQGALGRAWAAWRSVPRSRRLATFRWPLATSGALLAVALLVGARVAGASAPATPPYLAVTSIDAGGPALPASPARVTGASGGVESGAAGETAGVGMPQASGSAAASGAPQATDAEGGAAAPAAGGLPIPGGPMAGLPYGGGSVPAATGAAASGEPTSPAGTGPSATPSAAPRPSVAPVLAIGDSVMLGAVTQLRSAIHGIEVDAAVGRSFGAGLDILRQRQQAGLLPGTVVIGLGDNGWVTDQQVDQVMQLAGGQRLVVFINLKEPRSWESHDNAVLAQAAARFPNALLVDWHDLGDRHPEYFWDDGIHLRPQGAVAYAALLAGALAKAQATATPAASAAATPVASAVVMPLASAALSGTDVGQPSSPVPGASSATSADPSPQGSPAGSP